MKFEVWDRFGGTGTASALSPQQEVVGHPAFL